MTREVLANVKNKIRNRRSELLALKLKIAAPKNLPENGTGCYFVPALFLLA